MAGRLVGVRDGLLVGGRGPGDEEFYNLCAEAARVVQNSILVRSPSTTAVSMRGRAESITCRSGVRFSHEVAAMS